MQGAEKAGKLSLRISEHERETLSGFSIYAQALQQAKRRLPPIAVIVPVLRNYLSSAGT
jgi:hypothetical protein